MSNFLSVRRVMFQDLDEDGDPVGLASFGIIAYDSYDFDFNNFYDSFDQLNDAILKEGCILKLVDTTDKFLGVNLEKIGTDNYYGPFPDEEIE